ncbi:MAG: hypothetical protein ACT4RN_19125 [Pseudonocardia sp.]
MNTSKRILATALLVAAAFTTGGPAATASPTPTYAVQAPTSVADRPSIALAAFNTAGAGTASGTPAAADAPSSSPTFAANKWKLIIETVREAGTWVLDKLVSAAKSGYEAFKRAYDSLPSKVRDLLPYAPDIYDAICIIFGC